MMAAASGSAAAGAPGDMMILEAVNRDRDFGYTMHLPGGHDLQMSCDWFTWQKVVVAVEGRSALGQHISCLKGAVAPRKLAIWIHGGPWGYASKDLLVEQLAFLQSGYDLFVPLYPGSADRPMIIEGELMVPDLVDAIGELSTSLAWGRKHYDRVDVVGESFGAFLAASLAPALGESGTLYLMNPNLGGKPYLLDFYARTGAVPEITGQTGEGVQADVKRITEAYFHRLKDFDAMGAVRETQGLEIKLIHGGADDRVIPAEIAVLKGMAVPDCGVDYRPADGHDFGYTPAHYDATLKLIRCGCGSGTQAVTP